MGLVDKIKSIKDFRKAVRQSNHYLNQAREAQTKSTRNLYYCISKNIYKNLIKNHPQYRERLISQIAKIEAERKCL